MLPYINFMRYMRTKYGGRLGTVITVPREQFREDVGRYLHIGARDGQFTQALHELEVFGFIRQRRESIDILPSLF